MTETLRQRDGDQPLPTPNDHPDIQSQVIVDIRSTVLDHTAQLVINDLTARREVGIQRYGTALQPFNGRDVLRDAYEEALDLACYLRQAIAEGDSEDHEKLPALYEQALIAATLLRAFMAKRDTV